MSNGLQQRPINILPSHNLTRTRIVEQLGNSQVLARMVAEYRARGGRIQQREANDPFSISSTPASVVGQSKQWDAAAKPPLKTEGEEEKPNKQSDLNWTSKVSIVLRSYRGHMLSLPYTDCLFAGEHSRNLFFVDFKVFFFSEAFKGAVTPPN